MLNVTCPQPALHRAVRLAARGVSGRSTQPVQNNIYLQAGADTLRLAGTDLEFVSMEVYLPASVAEEGAVTVPRGVLSDVIGRLAPGEVTLSAGETNSLRVACGQSQFDIRGMSAADYEMLPELVEPLEFAMAQRDLHRILAQTIVATADDETRPILTGALLRFEPGGLEVVATDTYRVALRRFITAVDVDQPRSAIVSKRALSEVLRVMDASSEAPVQLALSDSQVRFTIGNVTIGSRLIEGQFPSYEKVLPDNLDRRVTVDCRLLAEALRRALIVAREDANRVVITGSDGGITVSAHAQDVGRVEEHLEATLEGERPEIAFNAHYLLDMLEAAGTEEIVMELAGPLDPGTMKPQGPDDYTYVIMPMQIM